MIKGRSEYLTEISKTYVCAEHGAAVVVAWHAGENCYVLRCGEGHYPEEVKRQPSYTEMYKQGILPTGPIYDSIERRDRQKMEQHPKPSTVANWGGVPSTDLATGELLTLEVRQALLSYAGRYNLDPYRGHVVVMYGKPYITIDGYLYHAYKTKEPFTLDSRPMTVKELHQYKIGETDHAWLAKVHFTESGAEFTGQGIVTYKEITAKSPRDETRLRSPAVAAHPWQLAQKRAEWQALRRAFPIGIAEENNKEV